MKKNTLGTLFVFEVIRFQKNLLSLKEHPIPSLGLSVVLHRESFCIIGPSGYNAKHCGSDIGVQAPLHRSPYVFVFFQDCRLKYNHARLAATLTLRVMQNGSVIGPQAALQHSPWSILDLRICAIIGPSGHNAKHYGSELGSQAIPFLSPCRCLCVFSESLQILHKCLHFHTLHAHRLKVHLHYLFSTTCRPLPITHYLLSCQL